MTRELLGEGLYLLCCVVAGGALAELVILCLRAFTGWRFERRVRSEE